MISILGLAETYLTYMPPFSKGGVAILIAVCVLMLGLAQLFWGRSQTRGRFGLWVLRGATLLMMAFILLGPTIVDEQQGMVTRPSMVYLFDGSQSMQLGNEKTRWRESIEFLDEAERLAGQEHRAHSQSFHFGHRLQPLKKSSVAELPNETDSRLGDALRSLLSQVHSRSSAGVVLFSDGRVRASETVEKLAAFFGESKVPIHVVPVGHESGAGDVVIMSPVVPDRVRKYTENEMQVFLRSYGFTGQRTTVRVLSENKIGDSGAATIASVPITLSSGAQSVSLTFRVGDQPEDLRIVVDPLPGELSDRNNQVQSRVDIDRTKVRVLYVEDESSVTQARGFFSDIFNFGTSQSTATSISGPLTVRDALQADEDIECTMMVSRGGGVPRALEVTNSAGSIALFPQSRAELFAYDCVVLNNVGPNVLSDQQNEWLTQWIDGRGGGLIVTGTDALKAEAWSTSPLQELLPIGLDADESGFPMEVKVATKMPEHSVWRLQLQEKLNGDLLEALPALMIGATGYAAKPTADILATRVDDSSAVMVSHRVGRGRVLVSTAELGGDALSRLADAWGPQPDRVAAKLWRNMVYWATEGSSTGRRRLVADCDKRFYRPGDSLSVFATAYDEAARRTQKYRIWATLEPAVLTDMSLYSPLLWPDGVVRESGETSPRIAWGEEVPLSSNPAGEGYKLDFVLSETAGVEDGGFQIEMTGYEGVVSENAWDHGTQVDSTSLKIEVLSDPFEQQNPLPNHELMARLASVSGGDVLASPNDLSKLLRSRAETRGAPTLQISPAWSQWWLWLAMLSLVTTEWVWRRMTGLA